MPNTSAVRYRERLTESEERTKEFALHWERYRFAGRFSAGKHVLDIACGTGYGARILRCAGAKSVLGVDISEEAVAYAKEHYQGENATFTVGDAETFRSDGSLDLIVSMETIEHLQNPEGYLDCVVQNLARDGIYIVSTPYRQSGTLGDRPENPYHVQEWQQDEFRSLLARYFREVDFYWQSIYFKKRSYPGSRTLASWLCRVISRSRYSEIGRPEVRPIPKIPGFPILPEYMVAVCRGCFTQERVVFLRVKMSAISPGGGS